MQLFRLDRRGLQAVPALGAVLPSQPQVRGPVGASAPSQASADQPAETPVTAAAPSASGPGRTAVTRPEPPASAGVLSLPAVHAPLSVGKAAPTTAPLDASAAGRPRPLSDAAVLAEASTPFNTPLLLAQNPDGSATTNPNPAPIASDTSTTQLSINFNQPLPTDIQGPIRVRVLNSDGTLGEVQQEIGNYSIQQGGTQVIIRPGSSIPAGQSFVLEFPTTCGGGTCNYPGQPVGEPLYVGFNSPLNIAPLSAATTGAAAAAAGTAAIGASFPVWAIVLGVVVVGFGIAAASGVFSSGDGGGGANPSSQ